MTTYLAFLRTGCIITDHAIKEEDEDGAKNSLTIVNISHLEAVLCCTNHCVEVGIRTIVITMLHSFVLI